MVYAKVPAYADLKTDDVHRFATRIT